MTRSAVPSPAPDAVVNMRSPRLRTLLIAYFSLLLAVAVITTGMIVYRGGHSVAVRLVETIQASSLRSIRRELDAYLASPMRANQANLAMARNGLVNLENAAEMVRVLWSQGTIHPDLGTIAYANDRGEFVGANRPENYVVLALSGQTGGAIRKIEPGPRGEITSVIISEKPGYDARRRDWYRTAVAEGRPVWTDISLSVTTARLDLSAVAPYYDDSGIFRGVFLVDVALEQINRLLQRQDAGERSAAFIVDRDGFLVGTSSGSVARRGRAADLPVRVLATEAPDSGVAQAARYVRSQWGGFSDIQGITQGATELGGQRHFVSAAPYQHGDSLDWVIVSAIPEAAVMGPIWDSARSTLALGAVAFLLTVLGGVWIANWVSRPLSLIGRAAHAMGKGDWTQAIELERNDEVGELAHAFNLMAQRLQSSLEGLSEEVSLRRRQAKELAESERRTRALLNAMPDIMFVNSEDGRFLDYQAKDPGQHFLPPQDIIGKTVFEVLPPESASAFMDLIHRALADDSVQTLECSFPLGEQEMFFEARAVPYQQGQTLTLCRDITEKLIAEREFRSLEQQLAQAQKLEAIGTLSSGIAHDFNNLLQAVFGYADLLSHELEAGSLPHQHAEKIKSAGDRGRELVQGLLSFSRKEDSDLRPVNLNREVLQATDLLQRTLPKMVSIRVALAENLRPVLADANQLGQILLNLGINACDAMPEGGVLQVNTVNVQLTEEDCASLLGVEPGVHVLLEVSDTGEGIEREHLARIFEPFFTTKGVGKGTGLGLSAVYGIVNSHRGSIQCESTVGRGTTFRIYFPAIEEGMQMETAPVVEPGPGPRGKGTILLVDDEHVIREMAQAFLEGRGYRVLTAASGEEALERYRENLDAGPTDGIDLVVLDLGMPGMGGRQCLRLLQEMDSDVSVLVATGYSLTQQSQGILNAGIVGHIGKPYRLAALATKIKDILAAP